MTQVTPGAGAPNSTGKPSASQIGIIRRASLGALVMLDTRQRITERRSAALMGLIAASLAVFATLHLAGILGGGSKPFRPDDAGIAEAITAIVLAYGAVALLRAVGRARVIALVATGFAMVSFIVGLSFTARGGDITDVVYHATGLPLLLSIFALLWWKTRSQ